MNGNIWVLEMMRDRDCRSDAERAVMNQAIKECAAIEDIKAEAYRKGWHDAICKALNETHNYYTEDGVFKAIQEESLIGVGMIMDADGKESK